MGNIIHSSAYTELTNAVQAIKGAILQSQQKALAAINQEQLALYYGIGRFFLLILGIRIGAKDSLKQLVNSFVKNYLD